jgi:hypothetical protein
MISTHQHNRYRAITAGSYMPITEVTNWLRNTCRYGSASMIESNYCPKYVSQHGALFISTYTIRQLIAAEVLRQMECEVFTMIVS